MTEGLFFNHQEISLIKRIVELAIDTGINYCKGSKGWGFPHFIYEEVHYKSTEELFNLTELSQDEIALSVIIAKKIFDIHNANHKKDLIGVGGTDIDKILIAYYKYNQIKNVSNLLDTTKKEVENPKPKLPNNIQRKQRARRRNNQEKVIN